MASTFTGGIGNDFATGSYDSMSGGGGDDYLASYLTGVRFYIDGGAGNDDLRVGSDVGDTYGWLVGGLGNDSLQGGWSSVGDILHGESGDDWAIGESGDDALDGGADRDRLEGGFGNDSISGRDGDDSGGPIRSGRSGTFVNPGLFGDAGDDFIDGGLGDDLLDGGSGNDTLMGGLGHDRFVVDSAGDIVLEDADAGVDTVEASIGYTLRDNVENLVLTGAAASGNGNRLNNRIVGTGGDNFLSGDSGADTLEAGGGDDLLMGGTGDDILIGGVGDDIFFVDSTGGVVTEQLGEGIDAIASSVDLKLAGNVENLVLTGSAVSGQGNELANIIKGNEHGNTLWGDLGNDTLDGGLGADWLVGGSGHDSYVLDSAGDLIVEAVGYGTDSAVTSVSYTLRTGVSVETLSALAGTKAIHLTGNSYANALVGNNAANKLNGAAGNDKLSGGLGNDILNGGYHNDMLIGGRGKDLMTGGSGKDRFVFDDRDTSASKSTADYLLDFRGSLGDRIDLKLVDANAKTVRDDPVAFIGKAAFTKAGQVRYEKAGSYTYVYLNTDADASAEAVIKLKGAMDLAKGWFVL